MKKQIIFLLLIYSSAFAQSLSVFDLNTDDFPTIKAKFFAFDVAGNQLTNLASSDFEIKEDGIIRKVVSVSCPNPKPPDALSSVLVMDASGSMASRNLDLAKEAARTWIKGLPLGYSECAITAFDTKNYLIQDFTTDKTLLEQKVNSLFAGGGTSYDAAFLNPSAGGILVAKTGKHKKVLVILTDGLPNTEPNTQKIINDANQNGIIVYAVTLGMFCPQCLKDISVQTGGAWFENAGTQSQVADIYRKILNIAQGGEPCKIEWESKISCDYNPVNVEIKLKTNNTSFILSYNLQASNVAALDFKPFAVVFKNASVGIQKDTTITVTAKNTDINVTNITSSSPLFDINPQSFFLKKNQSKVLTISFTPIDSIYSYSQFDFNTDICNWSYFATATYTKYRTKPSSLKLTHPNGGEIFVVGSDTVITWEGIPATDTVRLDYSIDNGKTWNLLTKEATGLIYPWKNIPKPPSNLCLVRVSTNRTNTLQSNKAPEIEWEKALGGSESEIAYSVKELMDGGFIVAGYSLSNDGNVSGNKGDADWWLVKLNSQGEVIWQRSLGGGSNDFAFSIFEKKDGEIIAAGHAASDDGDVNGQKGRGDYWIVNLDSQGNILWQRCVGGTNLEMAYSIAETSDGGFIAAGYTESSNGDVTEHHGNDDYWIVKFDAQGSLSWQKCLGGSSWEIPHSIIETNDGGYITAGKTWSIDGDITGSHGKSDVWIAKLDLQGNILWQKCYGGTNDEEAYSIVETSDGGYVIAGYSNSTDGDVSGNHKWYDYWVLKIDLYGNLLWQKSLGDDGWDMAYSIIETSDGGYLATGYSNSNVRDVIGNHGLRDFWNVKLDSDGNILWSKCYGGDKDDEANSIAETSDGGFIVAGFSESDNGDVNINHGLKDYWIVKLTGKTTEQEDISDSVFSIVMPIIESQDIDMKQVQLGDTKDSLIIGFIRNTGTYKFNVDSIYFSGTDASAFALVSGFPKYEVIVGDDNDAELRFTPSRKGIHQAKIVIVTQSDILYQNIRGEGVDKSIEVIGNIIDFGEVFLGLYKDTILAATIKNVGITPINILSTSHVGPNTFDFVTLAGQGPFTLNAGDTAKMSLRFRPSDAGRTNGAIAFEYEGAGSPAQVQLFAIGIDTTSAQVILQAGVASAFPGVHIEVPIYLKNSPAIIQSGTATLTTDLEFNSTLLMPVDEPSSPILDGIRTITLENLPLPNNNEDEITRVKFIAALGNKRETDLRFSNYSISGGNATIDTISGKFTLLGICPEGGDRFLNIESGNIQLFQVVPNPVNETAVLEFELIEDGITKIFIVNPLGEKVKIISNGKPKLGKQKVTVNIKEMPTGTYFIVLQTPTETRTQQLMIVR